MSAGRAAALRRLRPGLALLAAAALAGCPRVPPPDLSRDPAELRAQGIDRGLLRVSVGLEDPDDLLEDLRQALERA